MEFKDTTRKCTCDVHGDAVLVNVDIGRARSTVCKLCLDEAIDHYVNDLECARCGGPAVVGFGIQKDGVTTLYCRPCQAIVLFRQQPNMIRAPHPVGCTCGGCPEDDS